MPQYTVAADDGVLFTPGTAMKLTPRQFAARSHQVRIDGGAHVATGTLGFKKGEQVETVEPVTDKHLLVRLGQPPEPATPTKFRDPATAAAPAAGAAVKPAGIKRAA